MTTLDPSLTLAPRPTMPLRLHPSLLLTSLSVLAQTFATAIDEHLALILPEVGRASRVLDVQYDYDVRAASSAGIGVDS